MGKEEGLMSVGEADRAAVIEDVVKKRLGQREAAERLGIGVRQIKRLSRRYRERGAAGLVSGHRGKRPNNAIDGGVRREVVDLVRERYRDFEPTCAREAGGGARSSAVGGDAAPVDDRGWPAAREVLIAATDDAGTSFEAIAMPIGADEKVHFNSDDLETDNVSKGIGGIGTGQGDWRLVIVSGRRRRRRPQGEVRLRVRACASRMVASRDPEAGGAGTEGAVGVGAVEWQLTGESDRSVAALSLLESSTGRPDEPVHGYRARGGSVPAARIPPRSEACSPGAGRSAGPACSCQRELRPRRAGRYV